MTRMRRTRRRMLCDLELSKEFYFSVGCRRRKTIAEEGLCRVNEEIVLEYMNVSRGLYTLTMM